MTRASPPGGRSAWRRRGGPGRSWYRPARRRRCQSEGWKNSDIRFHRPGRRRRRRPRRNCRIGSGLRSRIREAAPAVGTLLMSRGPSSAKPKPHRSPPPRSAARRSNRAGYRYQLKLARTAVIRRPDNKRSSIRLRRQIGVRRAPGRTRRRRNRLGSASVRPVGSDRSDGANEAGIGQRVGDVFGGSR